MMWKVRKILDQIPGIILGIFIARVIFDLLDLKFHPEPYIQPPAPWYSEIFLDAAVCLIMLIICLAAKWAVKRRMNRKKSRR